MRLGCDKRPQHPIAASCRGLGRHHGIKHASHGRCRAVAAPADHEAAATASPAAIWHGLLPAGLAEAAAAPGQQLGTAPDSAASGNLKHGGATDDVPVLIWSFCLHAAQLASEAQRRRRPDRARGDKWSQARASSARWEAKPGTYKVSRRERAAHREAMAALREPATRDKGVKLLLRGAEKYPRNPFFPHSLGVHYWRTDKNRDEARRWLAHTVELDDSNPVALAAYARFLARFDTPQAARAMFERAVAVRPHLAWLE